MEQRPRRIRSEAESTRPARPVVDGSAQRLSRRLPDELLNDVKDPPTAGAAGDSDARRLQIALTDLRKSFDKYLRESAKSDNAEMQRLSLLRADATEAVQAAQGFHDIKPAVETAFGEITKAYGRAIEAAYIAGRGAAELRDLVLRAVDDDFSDVETSLSPRVADLGDLESKPATRRYPTYRRVKGPLFGRDGPQLTDVTQGALGDCWLLGPLSAAASTAAGQQKLAWMIRATNTGFTVFFNVAPADEDGRWTVVPINVISSFPMTNSGTFAYALARKPKPTPNDNAVAVTGGALWPAVIEKAWATRREGYDLLAGGEQPGAVFEAIYGVRSPATGEHRLGLPLRDSHLKDASRAIIEHMKRGDAVSIATKTHYVAVTKADEAGFTFRDQSDYQQQGDDVVATHTWAWSDLQHKKCEDNYFEFYVPSQALSTSASMTS